MIFLRSMAIESSNVSHNQYPFDIPAFADLEEIELRSSVTFFVGENGSGKSTLLEAIAYRCGFNTGGGGRNNTYEVGGADPALGNHLRLSWLPKVTTGFFLRAEAFFSFASYLDDLARDQGNIPEEVYGPYGGRSLHERSHGESFLNLFTHRFRGKGIYLLDEPEAALSPIRQLAFLRIVHDLEGDAQFIVATHSPILLGYPGAEILNFDTSPLSPVTYEATAHYQVTKGFLDDPERYLRKLFAD